MDISKKTELNLNNKNFYSNLKLAPNVSDKYFLYAIGIRSNAIVLWMLNSGFPATPTLATYALGERNHWAAALIIKCLTPEERLKVDLSKSTKKFVEALIRLDLHDVVLRTLAELSTQPLKTHKHGKHSKHEGDTESEGEETKYHHQGERTKQTAPNKR